MARSKKKFKKRTGSLYTIAAFIVAIIYLLFFAPLPEHYRKVELDGRLQVHMIDVGQADSILIVSPEGEAMLIDAGTNDSESALKSYLSSQKIYELKYAVFTHPHEDHIGGADMILDSIDVENVLLPDVGHSSYTYENMLNAIVENDVNAIFPSPGDSFQLGSAVFTVLGPISESYDEMNDTSIVLKLEYGNNGFMFTGDAEALSEREILSAFPSDMLKCDVLKVGHHGSTTSSCDEFLTAVCPSIALISCGEDNEYGHPHSGTLAALKGIGAKIYRTDYDGTVVLKADMESITVLP